MLPGTIIAGRFEVVEGVGAGGMGTVYRAHDRLSGASVAIKVVPVREPAVEERFQREAQLLATVSHPAIVRYVTHGRVPGVGLFLAMEWIEGETLERRLARGPLPVAETVALGRRVAEALGEAHAHGVVHRDVKPSNLILPGGDLTRVKLLDFGVAVVPRDVSLPRASRGAAGTPGYMAPEQARGEAQLDGRSDLFSLGCVLYECLTGVPAFSSGDVMGLLAKILVDEPAAPRSLRADLPGGVEALVLRLLGKSPASRPGGANELAAELAGLDLGERAGAAAPVRSEELRAVSIVMAGPPGGPGPDDVAAVRARFAALGAILEGLAGGGLLVTLSGRGAATDQAARAARCALALRAALPTRSIVLSTGRATVASSHAPAGRLPAGAVIERAAGMIGRVAPGEIAVCDVTAGLIDARFELARGKREARLVGERSSEAPRTLLGRALPCVGRDRELATLEGLYRECVAERVARAILVTSPAGVGKSRLVTELLARVLAPHESWDAPVVLHGRGDPLSPGAPFALLAPAIRRVCGVLDGEPIAARRDKLVARVTRVVPPGDARRTAEFLAELAGAPFTEGSEALRAARGDAAVMGDALRTAWEDWLRGETEAGPVVIVLDDLQWGDLPSLTLVDVALRNLREAPLLVVGLARPEAEEVFPGLWAGRDVQHMRLGALPRRAAHELVRAALGDRVDEAALAGILTRAGGNAFFLEELVRAVAAGGSELPETVLMTVQARLDALGADERRVLRAASVFGHRFWLGGAAALLGETGAATLREWLDDLVAREFVARAPAATLPGETEFAFRHELVREAAYAMLPAGDRREAHRVAAGWLEQAGEPSAAVLAEHFDRGGEPERAAAYYCRAAEQALGGNDLAAAVRNAERGIAQLPEGGDLGRMLLVKAEAMRWRGDPPGARRHATQALERLPPGTVAWFQAAGEIIVSSGRLGDNQAVERWAREAASVTPAPGAESAQVSAICRGAAQLVQAGLHEPAAGLIARVEELARGPIDGLAVARLHRLRAKRALHRGDVQGFLRGQELAVQAFALAGDARNACSERGDLGFAYLEVGDLARAEASLRQVVDVADHLGLPHVAPWAWNNLGTVLSHRGDAEEAERYERLAVEAGVEHRDRRLEGGSRINLALILAAAGRHPEAADEASLAVDLLEPAPPRRAAALAALARALVALGLVDEAAARAREAAATLERLGGLDEGESLVRLVHAEVLGAAGEEAAARAALARAHARLLERAALIEDEGLRESFLSELPDNARTLELAAAWGVARSPA